jgi:hypothetical protein
LPPPPGNAAPCALWVQAGRRREEGCTEDQEAVNVLVPAFYPCVCFLIFLVPFLPDVKQARRKEVKENKKQTRTLTHPAPKILDLSVEKWEIFGTKSGN